MPAQVEKPQEHERFSLLESFKGLMFKLARVLVRGYRRRLGELKWLVDGIDESHPFLELLNTTLGIGPSALSLKSLREIPPSIEQDRWVRDSLVAKERHLPKAASNQKAEVLHLDVCKSRID
jgi:hypothetical protein